MSELSKPSLGLSQWSFHRAILGDSRSDYEWFLRTLHSASPERILRGELAPEQVLQYAVQLGVRCIDPVNILFFSRVQDHQWLAQWRHDAHRQGITFSCLMCDELGLLGARNRAERQQAIARHLPWLEAAQRLGCNILRVNAYGEGSYLQQLNQCSESLKELADYAAGLGLQLVVENHGHPTGNGAWLAMLIEACERDNLGVYLDFDNFCMGGWNLDPERRYDRYQGCIDLAPYTLGVSAKSYAFDPQGRETRIDYQRCLDILVDHEFSGVIAAEYEGEADDELGGTRATLDLLKSLL
ncbi:sugar phosphate isomerase/epimerase family protein [Aliagarivorans taiwanensis]|uniref:sugar phosphate isomerase/epimerase family protein n=1 Tax=Aliagarivorans taiwanensis TaxID=561966 RepID=UPI000418AB63|nr:sugar phosphate isomerase/epimerase family protein [Aliagarivorans taiwanensis]